MRNDVRDNVLAKRASGVDCASADEASSISLSYLLFRRSGLSSAWQRIGVMLLRFTLLALDPFETEEDATEEPSPVLGPNVKVLVS